MSDYETGANQPHDTDRDASTDEQPCEHASSCANTDTERVFVPLKNTYKHLCDEHARRVGPDGRDSEVAR